MSGRWIRGLILLGLLAGIVASFVRHPDRPHAVPPPPPPTAPVAVPQTPAPRVALYVPPPPPPKPGADRIFDGTGWRDYYWAPDEAHLTLKPGLRRENLPAGTEILNANAREVTIRTPAMKREAWSDRAAELRLQPGVGTVLPVYYPSATALSRRQGPRLFLTPGVLVTLPADADPARVAARTGAQLANKLDFLPNTYLFKAAGPFESLDLAATLTAKEGASLATPQFAMLPVLHGIPPNDPEYPNQWHLKNTGQSGGLPGEDVKAEAAWAITLGGGAVVGVVDTGMQIDHPDLAPNYLASASHDFNDIDGDPSPVDIDPDPANEENHATAVAGVAAARGDNGIGVSGIAPMAQIAGLRLLSGLLDDATIASCMSFKNNVITVKNNSWGFKGQNDPTLDTFPHGSDLVAISDGFVNGRGGKGLIYVFSAGNGAGVGDSVNTSKFCTMREAITVGSVDYKGQWAVYSNPGAALLVCTQSGGGTPTTLNIDTTDRTAGKGYNPAASPTGDYTGAGGTEFSGTSSAAPLVSGVVALMISANPNLSSRDVQHVLVRSSRKVAPGDASWFNNAVGNKFSHLFGHGAVDAGAAVAMSQNFPYSAAVSLAGTSSTFTPPMDILDSPGGGAFGPAVSDTLTVTAPVPLRVEHVEVFLNATHTFRGDLRIRLTHAGTTSILALNHGDPGNDYLNWKFLSTAHWGESSLGNWTLTIDDGGPLDVGTFDSWRIHVWGTPIDATPPVTGTVRDGIGSDLQVQDSATSLSANWVGFSDPQSGIVYEWALGSSPGATDLQGFQSTGYATSATATGLTLTAGATYYATVRATNFEGLQNTATSDGVLIAPDTTITGHPTDPSGVISPTFTFSANEGGCTFLYSIDGGALVSNGASTTATIGPLGAGVHTFSVFAVSGLGYADPTPAVYSWNLPVPIVDGTAPFLNSFDGGIFLTNWTSASTGAPAWDVDGTPANILGTALPYFTEPASLNYNNGTDYDTGGASNSGTLTSPVIDVSAVPAGSRIKFLCNYDTDSTGTTTDRRSILIMNPALTVTLATIQLSAGASAAGPCSAMGIWHEHVLPIQGGWGSSFRIRFSFDTVNATNNAHAGWFIDDLELSDLEVTALTQYIGSSLTVLPVGGSTLTQSIRIQGMISQLAAVTLTLEVEVQPASVPFTGVANFNSGFSGGAGNPMAVVINPAPGEYHWRARTVTGFGAVSAWMDFGLNSADAPDFIISTPPAGPPPSGGGGGGGGCGATGLEWLAVAGLLLLRRLRR